MNKGSRLVINLFFILLLLLLSMFLYSIIMFFSAGSQDDTVKVGLILKGGRYDNGYDGVNASGAEEAGDDLGIKLIIKDNVEEEEAPLINAVDSLIQSGCKAIIFSSYGYESIMEKYADIYVDRVFYFNAPTKKFKNFVRYSGRDYQARYLAGLIAGKNSLSGHVGYIAPFPNDDVLRGLNAFTLGVRRSNQHAVVDVYFTGSLYDREKGIEGAEKLISDRNCDVIAEHENSNYAVSTARDNNVKYISCHVSTGEDCEIACVYTDWGKIYSAIIKDFIRGTVERNKGYWLGLEGDYVGVSGIDDTLPDYFLNTLEFEKSGIINGIDVFSGNIKDSDGVMRCRSGEIIPDKGLTDNMDWYIQGVKICNEEQEG